MTQVNADTVISAYLKLRDKRSDLKKAYDAEDQVYKDQMEKLEGWLMGQLDATGATKLGSAHGTAYEQMKWKGSCSDWPSFWESIVAMGRFDFVEKRISVKSIQEYYEESGELPAGVNIQQERGIIIRRS